MTRRDVFRPFLVGVSLLAAHAPSPAPAEAPLAGPDDPPSHLQRTTGMLLIRDVFRCKPGTARQVAEMFKKTIPSMEQEDGFRNCRVMVDYVASYWTVILQAEVDEIRQFDYHMEAFGKRPEVREALSGYLEMVESGHREIYRIL